MDKHFTFKQKTSVFNPLNHVDMVLDAVQDNSIHKDIVVKWRRIIKNIYKQQKENPVVQPFHKEIYSLIVGYQSGSFEYRFDIDGAREYIKEHNIKPKIGHVTLLVDYIDVDNIEPNYTKKPKNDKNPIILVGSPLFNQTICINGNHRIFEAHKNGITQLEVYTFNDDTLVHLMYDLLSKAFYLANKDFLSFGMPYGSHNEYLYFKKEDYLKGIS